MNSIQNIIEFCDQHFGFFGENSEGDVVSAWDRKTGSLLYQVSTLSSIDTMYNVY